MVVMVVKMVTSPILFLIQPFTHKTNWYQHLTFKMFSVPKAKPNSFFISFGSYFAGFGFILLLFSGWNLTQSLLALKLPRWRLSSPCHISTIIITITTAIIVMMVLVWNGSWAISRCEHPLLTSIMFSQPPHHLWPHHLFHFWLSYNFPVSMLLLDILWMPAWTL